MGALGSCRRGTGGGACTGDDALFDAAIRLEHRTNAVEQGMVAARNMLGAGIENDAIPFAWTDQCDLRIRTYGWCSGSADVDVQPGAGDRTFVARFRRKGRLVGIAGCGAVRELRALREELEAALRCRLAP